MRSALALFGGKPVVKRHESLVGAWPPVSKADELAVMAAFRRRDFSGRESPSVENLEHSLSSWLNRRVTALANATAALHVALIAVGVKPNDEVIVPNLTFIAPATAVLHAHAIPVFADIDRRTYNIDPEDVARRVTDRTRAVIVVHLHGFPADIYAIRRICKLHKLALIEDVAQAPGATINDKLVGTFGDAAAFSFMPQKNIGSCGELGALVTRTLKQKRIAELVRIYGEVLAKTGPRAYNSYTLGWNYTATPLAAAMATTQLEQYPETLRKIQQAGRQLTAELRKFAWVEPPEEVAGTTAVFHFYRIRLRPTEVDLSDAGRFRQAVQDALAAENLHTRLYQTSPLSGHPVFQRRNPLGHGVPWVCTANDRTYGVEEYPVTLDVLRSTCLLGGMGSAPAYLCTRGTVDRYVEGFSKLEANMDALVEYAKTIRYREPWKAVPVVSDSFGRVYRMPGDLLRQF
jgi:perosamine synthetase